MDGQNGSPNMVTITVERFPAQEAHEGAELPTGVKMWLLANWRVPRGVERSADWIAQQLQWQLLRESAEMGGPSLRGGPLQEGSLPMVHDWLGSSPYDLACQSSTVMDLQM